MGEEEKPKGGHDPTPMPKTDGPTYTLEFTFHQALNLPISDIPAGTSDPYILAQLETSLPSRHEQDPKLRFRTQTIHRTVEPKWESRWVVAGIPSSGFDLKVRIYDEDVDDHDDKLGKVFIQSGRIDESFKIEKREYRVKKRGADLIAYGLRWGKTLICRNSHTHARLILSIKVVGKTEDEVGKAYTMNNFWWKHYSPLIGRLAGVKSHNDKGIERYK